LITPNDDRIFFADSAKYKRLGNDYDKEEIYKYHYFYDQFSVSAQNIMLAKHVTKKFGGIAKIFAL
jgi:hypothetical protein